MTVTFGYECYADEDLFLVLRRRCNLALQGHHSYSQGEVINDLLVRKRVDIGMVDEDPQSSHHRARDQMMVIRTNPDLELRVKEGRYLIIVKPELEECFLRSTRRLNLDSELPQRATDLQTLLNIKGHPKHKVFQAELNDMYDKAREKRLDSLITLLEDAVRYCLRRE